MHLIIRPLWFSNETMYSAYRQLIQQCSILRTYCPLKIKIVHQYDNLAFLSLCQSHLVYIGEISTYCAIFIQNTRIQCVSITFVDILFTFMQVTLLRVCLEIKIEITRQHTQVSHPESFDKVKTFRLNKYILFFKLLLLFCI